MTAPADDLAAARLRRALSNPLKSDVVNADRFVARYGEEIRFETRSQRWFCWNGRCWSSDDLLSVEFRAQEITREMFRLAKELGGDSGADLGSAALALQNATRIRGMLGCARSRPAIAVTPEMLDADPMLLNAANGVIDLATGELRAHSRALLMTKFAPVEYPERESAECPRWLAFLEKIFAGDQELIAYLQRAIGYTLTGDTREQCLHIMHGTGANGKSTFLEILADVMGTYALQADFATFVERKFTDGPRNDLARLAGARFVRASEVGEGKRFNEALVQGLTGSETVSARFLFSEAFEFRPTFKLWFATNHKPVIRSTGHAIWRRVRLIPFSVTIGDAEKDDTLLGKLRAELPGILRWAVDGCIAWQHDGLKPPSSVLAATADYRSESDTLGAFIEDSCHVAPEHEERATVLFNAYRAWAKAGEEYVMNQTTFGRRLEERNFPSVRRGGVKYRRGLCLHETALPKPHQLF